MNYNLKVEMERINGNVVSNIEVSSAGRATRKRIVSPDFDTAQVDLKKVHTELLGQLETFHAPAAPAPAPETPLPAPAAKPKAKGKVKKAAPKKTPAPKAPAKKAAKGKAKGK